MAYPEVQIDPYSTSKVQLMNTVYKDQDDFDHDFRQIIWVSYRKNFAPLMRFLKKQPDSDIPSQVRLISSDCGWGCMLRCA
jgi:hypothetical protein